MWKKIYERFERKKRIYLFLIVIAFALSFLGTVMQTLFVVRGKELLICDDLSISFYKDYSFAVVNNKVYECQKIISPQENVVMCLISETESGYRSYLLYDRGNSDLYLAVGHRTRPVERDDCFIAGFAYSPSLKVCVDTTVKKCVKQ